MSINWNGKKPVVDCSKDRGFTVQADRDDADINKIIARLEKGAMLERNKLREPFYGDVSELSDLQESLIKVQKANELFMGFDASIRERFDNDPTKFVEFFENSDNLKEAIELGLIMPRPEAESEPTSPAPEPGK
ncbi:MAG: internal scaffolding protein [Microvirus sp.]|nr:MAG: internal scaffolding protein [Microvirus sp.]